MHVTIENTEHFYFTRRLGVVEQALIFHPSDNRRQHFGILLWFARTQYLEKLACALEQNLLM